MLLFQEQGHNAAIYSTAIWSAICLSCIIHPWLAAPAKSSALDHRGRFISLSASLLTARSSRVIRSLVTSRHSAIRPFLTRFDLGIFHLTVVWFIRGQNVNRYRYSLKVVSRYFNESVKVVENQDLNVPLTLRNYVTR